MGFLNWSVLLPLLPLIPLLVTLYFLKLKRPVREIPSTLLWQKVLEDDKVNSPFQRFKNNLLLLLQLLLLCALILAAMQPFIERSSHDAIRQIIAIDTSASMGAIYKSSQSGQQDAENLLELVIEQTREIIDALRGDQELAIVSFDQQARQHVGFTSDKRKLKRALDEVKLRQVEGKIKPALKLMTGLAHSNNIDRVQLFSDGNFNANTDFDLPFPIRFNPPSPPGKSSSQWQDGTSRLDLINIGVTHLSAQIETEGSLTVLARLSSSRRPTGEKSLVSAIATLTLLNHPNQGESEVLNTQTVNWSEGESISLTFQIPKSTFNEEAVSYKIKTIALEIKPEQPDSLLADNKAYLSLIPPKDITVDVPSDIHSVHAFFRKAPDVRLQPSSTEDPVAIRFLRKQDEDDEVDLPMPTAKSVGTVIHINQMPSNLNDLIELKSNLNMTAMVDWRRDIPLLRYVDLREILVMDASQWRQSAGSESLNIIALTVELEKRGYKVLIDGPQGPLLLSQNRHGQLHYYFLFDPDRSTLPYQLALPLMLTNLLSQQRQRMGGSRMQADPTGVLAFEHPDIQYGQRYLVTSANGEQQTLTCHRHGELTGIKAPAPGTYRIRPLGGGDTFNTYTSLVSAQETSLISANEIKFNDQQVVTASTETIAGNKPIWHLIVKIGFFLLIIEWWFYNHPQHRVRLGQFNPLRIFSRQKSQLS